MNALEEQALETEYLTHEAYVLYSKCIRKHMDYRTGITGIQRKVSYQMFKERLEIRRKRGSKLPDFVPTIKQVRGYIDELIEVGLIEKLPTNKRTDPMVFRCVLATTDLNRLNEEGQRKGKGHGQSLLETKTQIEQGVSEMPQCDEGQMKDKAHGHTSVTSVSNNNYIYSDNRKFPISIEWKPTEQFKELLWRNRISTDSGQHTLLITQFISHYLGKPGMVHSQHEWESRLIGWMKRDYSNTQNEKPLLAGQASSGSNDQPAGGSNGQHPPSTRRSNNPPRKLSTVDRQKQSTDEYLERLRRETGDSGGSSEAVATYE